MGSPPVTPNYDLVKPPAGETGWTNQVNGNWDIIDAELHALATGGSTGPAGPPGAPGAVGMIYAGPWAPIINYVVTDAVTFNGSFYIATANNVNAQPDTHPTSWSILAAAGAAGPPGPTGPPGPGGGTAITLPVSVANGGTGAEDETDARTNLGAAASGNNSDITSLSKITTGITTSGQQGITIVSPGGSGNAITFSNGNSSGGFTTDAIGFLEALNVAGLCNLGNVTVSGLLKTSSIGNAVPGGEVTLASLLAVAAGLLVQGSVPAAVAGQIGFGASTAATASNGTGQAMPANVDGYLIFNNQGTLKKIPFVPV